MSYWAEIKANYNEYKCAAPEDDIVSSICIDAWKTNNGNKGGSVIAKVIMTRSGDKGVVYINNLARSDPHAQEVIKETFNNMVLPPKENTVTAFIGNGTSKHKCKCGNGYFYAHQLCRHDIIMDGDGNFEQNIEIYDSERPYGTFTCTSCGANYEELSEIPDAPCEK